MSSAPQKNHRFDEPWNISKSGRIEDRPRKSRPTISLTQETFRRSATDFNIVGSLRCSNKIFSNQRMQRKKHCQEYYDAAQL
ncbi:hypothetical protein KIN20_027768 [Parelaphostrongylus tenuis]|uniref:Uncharacterized protein n=1 Tax=Parelaphostrongylus tenuis TaxID=148309 RepID=A0AAD5WEE4_PARTN|nr:hypothetical protein KIN20_027768 [Parelaphostrongylus tenuis]